VCELQLCLSFTGLSVIFLYFYDLFFIYTKALFNHSGNMEKIIK